MTAFESLRFKDLPPQLRARLVEADFLTGRRALDPDHLIMWMLDRAVKNSCELEWSPSRGEFLTEAERSAVLGAPRELPLSDRGLVATLSYAIAARQHLEERLVIVDSATGVELVRASQDVYSPARLEPAEFARQKLETARFPSVYAAWNDDAKVDYWMRTLYRLRRSNGESGYDVDTVLSPPMVDDMRRLDPQIERRLPAIAQALARMEGDDAAQMLRKLRGAQA